MQDVNSKMPGEFVKWEELDISNDFMFGKVMQDPELCRELLQRILPDLEIDHVEYPEMQKGIQVDIDAKSVRLETVVQLSKGEIQSKKIRVDFSLEDMDMSGFQKGATYGEIKTYVKEHTGLTVSSLYIAQVKQKCGIIERENYNKPKSEDSRQPQCPPEKEAAIRAALEYFKMI